MHKKVDDKLLNEAGKSYVVQKDQMNKMSDRLGELGEGMTSLSEINNNNLDNLDNLLNRAKDMMKKNNMKIEDMNNKDYLKGKNLVEKLAKENRSEKETVGVPIYEDLETIEVDDNIGWDDYLENINIYANKNSLDLNKDPFYELLTAEDKKGIVDRLKNDYSLKKANCDKYDYMIASFCGVLAGLVDSFFVGMPKASKLGNWSDKQVDKWVINIAKMTGCKSSAGGKISIVEAITHFEKNHKVNYDQATGKAANDLLGMTMKNHHIKSLGHAPDLIGLIFSIVDQFTSTSHFLDNGRLITFDTKESKLKGGNFLAKLFCGISNWIGHLISDVAGSSTTRKKDINRRGTGLPMPLFELFQLIGNGNSKDGFNKMSLADLSVKMFEQDYDARFGLVQAIPVFINEISIRLLWTLKARFYADKPWKECLPFGNNPELRRMLLTGHGVLCIVDGLDAGLRSGGEILTFALHLNFVAWKRLAFSGLMEIRAIYKENAIDLDALEKDLELEWNKLYGIF